MISQFHISHIKQIKGLLLQLGPRLDKYYDNVFTLENHFVDVSRCNKDAIKVSDEIWIENSTLVFSP